MRWAAQCQNAGFVSIPMTPVCQPSFAPGTGSGVKSFARASTDDPRAERATDFADRDFDTFDFAAFARVLFGLLEAEDGRARSTAMRAEVCASVRGSSAMDGAGAEFWRLVATLSGEDA
jgi:hypothetical protein